MRYAGSLTVLLLVVVGLDVQAQTCSDAATHSSGTHRFRRVGETLEIPFKTVAATVSAEEGEQRQVDCHPVSLELRWTNGRNSGSVFQILVQNSEAQSIYARQISAFLVGMLHIPLTGVEAQEMYGQHLISVPAKVVIQAKHPFALPANISYSITWVESQPRNRQSKVIESDGDGEESRYRPAPARIERTRSNEVVRVRNVFRLIGSSRVSLVQIELKSATPFPVREIPLQVRIGDRVFLNELSGEYTGRILTLSLTPEMFASLEDGAEIVAFFDDRERWSFGRLVKSRLDE